MKKISAIIFLLFLFLHYSPAFSQCGNCSNANCSNKSSCSSDEKEFKSKQNEFSKEDSVGLMLMREEEKMAHDIYVAFYKQYDRRVFDNISQSESMHMSAVLSLINHFKLNDPALQEEGKFRNPEIQKLYAQLMSRGTDLVGALKAAAYVEEYDILDLKKCIDKTQNDDIKNIYSNLLFASKRHLNAFVRNLSVSGVDYKPQLMAEKEYLEIIE